MYWSCFSARGVYILFESAIIHNLRNTKLDISWSCTFLIVAVILFCVCIHACMYLFFRCTDCPLPSQQFGEGKWLLGWTWWEEEGCKGMDSVGKHLFCLQHLQKQLSLFFPAEKTTRNYHWVHFSCSVGEKRFFFLSTSLLQKVGLGELLNYNFSLTPALFTDSITYTIKIFS